MSYTVLARRYRSHTFEDVVGQEAVARTLKNAIETDRVAHAYLFSGTRGVGKTSMARILAKALNCLAAEGPTATPCCECESCLAINEGEDIDVIEIDGASNTGVDHIRELRQNAIYRPARARFKVYIIDEVHMLSISAFNALLKTLEEPPEFVKFILATTEPNKVPATILSRCQRFDFRNILPADILGHLKNILAEEGVEAEESLLRRIARLAHGSMRDSLSLLDQILSMSDGKLTLGLLDELLGTPRSERIIELAETIGQNDLGGALNQVDRALSEGLALEQLALALQGHFRDLMVLRSCGEQTELVDMSEPAVREKMAAQAGQFDEAALVYYITVLEELRRAIKSSGSGRALLEAAIVRLTASERFSDTRSLLEQLQQLQAGGGTAAARGTPPPTPAARPAAKPAAPPSVKPPAAPEPKSKEPVKAKDLELPATLTLDYLQGHWEEILDAFKGRSKTSLAAYIQLARPTGWEDGKLTLGYKPDQDGMRRMLEEMPDQMEEIGEVFGQVLGREVRLSLGEAATKEDNASLEGPAVENGTPANNGGGRKPPGAKPSQAEINAAMSEPSIRRVQEILGGKMRHIERMGE